MSKWNSIVISFWSGKYVNDFSKDIRAYKTFGNHDYFTVSPVDGENASEVLKEMWNRTDEFSNSIKYGESIHNLFAVAQSEGCENFWNNEKRFLFVSEIQLNLKDSADFDKQVDDFNQEIKELLNAFGLQESNDFILYYSLDCADVILLIKTDRYTTGADVINQLTIKSHYRHYSYSVCGLKSDLILQDKDYTEIIPKVVICSVFSDASNYDEWLNKFKEQYPNELTFDDNTFKNVANGTNNTNNGEFVHFSRLGNEDVCINIYNCNLKHFIEMTTLNEGVFSHNNVLCSSTFSRLRIQFDVKFKDVVPSVKRKMDEGKSLIANQSEFWKEILKRDDIYPFVRKAIIEVLSAVENLEKKEFAADIQDCVRNVFALFVSKIDALTNSYNEDPKDNFEICRYTQENLNEDLILFTTGIMSITNGSLHADKMFIDVPGFNAVLCDIPAKLLVYYTAFIQILVDALNDSDILKYKFILCPDLYLKAEVIPLFYYQKTDSQLLKARIPIKKVFDPQMLLMELSHEAAHYVDTNIRCRCERVDAFAEIIAIILSNKILKPIASFNEEEPFKEMTLLKSFFSNENYTLDDMLDNEWKQIRNILKQALCRKIDLTNREDIYLESVAEKFRDEIYNLLFCKTNVEGEPDNFFNLMCKTITTEEMRLKRFSDVTALFRIMERHIFEVIEVEYGEIIATVQYLLSESFADLIMLFITRDIKSYLYNIYEAEKGNALNYNGEIKYRWNDVFAGAMHMERIVSVLRAFDFDLKQIETEDKEFQSFILALNNYADKDNCDYRNFPYGVIDVTVEYLKTCLEKLKKKEPELKQLIELYEVATTSNSVETCINKFRECAYMFRYKIEIENELLQSN